MPKVEYILHSKKGKKFRTQIGSVLKDIELEKVKEIHIFEADEKGAKKRAAELGFDKNIQENIAELVKEGGFEALFPPAHEGEVWIFAAEGVSEIKKKIRVAREVCRVIMGGSYSNQMRYGATEKVTDHIGGRIKARFDLSDSNQEKALLSFLEDYNYNIAEAAEYIGASFLLRRKWPELVDGNIRRWQRLAGNKANFLREAIADKRERWGVKAEKLAPIDAISKDNLDDFLHSVISPIFYILELEPLKVNKGFEKIIDKFVYEKWMAVWPAPVQEKFDAFINKHNAMIERYKVLDFEVSKELADEFLELIFGFISYFSKPA